MKDWQRIVVTGIAFLGACISCATTLKTETYKVVEWSYTSDEQYENPFKEVDITAHVILPDGNRFDLPGFWAGGKTWKFRYASGLVGKHQFTTSCSDESNPGLHNQSGTILVSGYLGDNPLYKNGPLKISQNRRHFVHQDGTPFFWLADSWWHAMTSRFKWPGDFKELTADRKRKGFSVIQFAVGFPCDIAPFDKRGQNEAGDPWDSDLTSINPAYFDLADKRIEHLLEQGMVPNIVGLWGYYMKFLGVDIVQKHWDYLIARYGAYPVTWTLCGESTLAYYTDLAEHWDFYKDEFRRKWSEVAWHVQASDPFDRLLTVHPGPGIHDGKPPIYDMDALDFIMLQSGHEGYHTIPKAKEFVSRYMKEYPNQPIMHGEVCFEGMHGGGSGQKVQRILFWSDILSGTSGFCYGVEGIWQFNTKQQPFGLSPTGNNWGNVPWDVAAQYPGSTQLGIGKNILENFEWWKLEPNQDWVEQSGSDDVFKTYVAGIGEDLRIAYLYRFVSRYRSVTISGLTQNTKYRAIYYDPITGDSYDQGILLANSDGKIAAPPNPIMQDWVLVLEKFAGQR